MAVVAWVISTFIQPILPQGINSSLILFFVILLAVLGAIANFKDTLELIRLIFGKPNEKLKLDQDLFLEIRRILPSDGAIAYISKQDYATSFSRNIHDDLKNFRVFCERPECEFMDKKLEDLRLRLYQHIDVFLNMIGQYTFIVEIDPTRASVQRDPYTDHETISVIQARAKDEADYHRLMDEQRKRVTMYSKNLNNQADAIYKLYTDFIRLGRRKLSV